MILKGKKKKKRVSIKVIRNIWSTQRKTNVKYTSKAEQNVKNKSDHKPRENNNRSRFVHLTSEN